MANVYASFLSAPSAAALAPNATLHYITTTTSIHDATAIIKHLQAQEKLVKKKHETILSSITSGDAIVLETETRFEFVRGGGALLPQMDDNMLVDSLVTLPMVHIVQLNSAGKISQIRLHWDQSTMLKQVDAIGRTGRNWPIRDGTAMTNLIKNSVSTGNSGPAPQSSSGASSQPDEVVITSREGDNQDYHSRLFAPAEERRSIENQTPGIAKRMSAKPAPRQWGELFADENTRRSPSPGKAEGAKAKAGSDRNFAQNRIFDRNAIDASSPSPERKHDHSHYQHFEFGNGEEAPPRDGNRPPSAKAQKHMNNWDFEDFNTPPKVTAKPLMEQERHFGHGVDEDEPASPPKRPIVHAPRPDAGTHFAMTDVSPAGERQQPKNTRPDSLASHLKTDNGLTAEQNKENAPFDDLRQGGRNTKSNARTENEKSHWRPEETPEKVHKIYKTAGDGMGGRKDAGRDWMIGGEQPDVKQAKIYKTYGNGMGGRRDAAPEWSWGDRDDQVVPQQSKDRKMYKTAGNGMGSHSPRLKPPHGKRTTSPLKRPRNFSDDPYEIGVPAVATEQRIGIDRGDEKSMKIGEPPA